MSVDNEIWEVHHRFDESHPITRLRVRVYADGRTDVSVYTRETLVCSQLYLGGSQPKRVMLRPEHRRVF